jgi:aminoglycoside 3-N-acetyltransferase
MTVEYGPRPRERGTVGRDQLVADLRSLGMRRGQDLLIHCSLRRMGRIDGGAATLLDAIRATAGLEATLVVPTQTTLNSLTSCAFLTATAGLDEEERARFVAAMPGFDPASTPSVGMGAFAEYVRTCPGASRSTHPQVSFSALGPRARSCTSVHDLDCHLGERSPPGWLYNADSAILLLGVGYAACTAFPLAEYRLSGQPRRVHLEFAGAELDDSDFEMLGAELESASGLGVSSGVRRGWVGSAPARLVQLGMAIDFACSSARPPPQQLGRSRQNSFGTFCARSSPLL